MFMVLSSWQSHYESSSGSFDEYRMAPSGRRPKTKPDDLGCESACTGCHISYSLVCHFGSAFKVLLLTGLGPICPLAVFVSNAITTSPLYTLVSVVSPKAQFLAL